MSLPLRRISLFLIYIVVAKVRHAVSIGVGVLFYYHAFLETSVFFQ